MEMMNQEKRLFFFGDSICFGQGVAIHKGWVPRISRLLGEKEITVMNAAVNGNTTRLALERMPYEIQSHNPDALVVQFGMNDCNHWETDMGVPRVSKKSFIANMQEIVERARVFGAKCIFVNTNHPTTRTVETMAHTSLTYQQSNAEYNQAIREAFGGSDDIVTLIDMEKAFEEAAPTRETLAELLLPDALHLSEAGHDLYYNVVAPIISERLERCFSS